MKEGFNKMDPLNPGRTDAPVINPLESKFLAATSLPTNRFFSAIGFASMSIVSWFFGNNSNFLELFLKELWMRNRKSFLYGRVQNQDIETSIFHLSINQLILTDRFLPFVWSKLEFMELFSQVPVKDD